MKSKELFANFEKAFGHTKNLEEFFAPGRVNLIGEHIDYNGGFVFPCALTFGTHGVFSKREDKRVRLYSGNFEQFGILEFDLNDYSYKSEDQFANYVKGICFEYEKLGLNFENGFDVYYFGEIPNGSGLSSSASLEVLTAFAIREMFDFEISLVKLVKLCQRVENHYMGVNSGIMDQFIIGLGKEGHAMLLNTESLEYFDVPARMEGISIVIGNTNKKRELADSKYNERRSECERALAKLQTKVEIKNLCDLSRVEFDRVSDVLEGVELKRARHAVYENERTKESLEALNDSNFTRFGELMTLSHHSLQYDYEVTCTELDTLVSQALKQKGVLGSRMTGAGFGGCTVSLVEDANVEAFIKNVGDSYEKEIGYKADFYVASVGSGVKRMNSKEV
jgi:galactokinase